MSRWPAFLFFIAAAVSMEGRAQDQHANYRPPVTKLAQYELTDGQTLGVVSGTWAASGGTFNSTSTTTAIATIDSYLPEINEFPDLATMVADKFWYGARMLNERSGANTRVGIVYLDRSPSGLTSQLDGMIETESCARAHRKYRSRSGTGLCRHRVF